MNKNWKEILKFWFLVTFLRWGKIKKKTPKSANFQVLLSIFRLYGNFNRIFGEILGIKPHSCVQQDNIAGFRIKTEAGTNLVTFWQWSKNPSFVALKLGLPNQPGVVVGEHDCPLFVAHKNVLLIRCFHIVGKKWWRNGIDFPQLLQNGTITITKCHIPARVSIHFGLRHFKNFPQLPEI